MAQATYVKSTQSGFYQTLALSFAPSVGNTVIVFVAGDSPTVSDNRGHSWTQLATTAGTGATAQRVMTAFATKTTSAITTLTVGAASNAGVVVNEWSGLAKLPTATAAYQALPTAPTGNTFLLARAQWNIPSSPVASGWTDAGSLLQSAQGGYCINTAFNTTTGQAWTTNNTGQIGYLLLGLVPVRKGSTSTSLTLTPAAAGHSNRSGNAAETLVLTSSAVGSAPTVDAHSGSAALDLALTATAIGRKVPRGSAHATLDISSEALGSTQKSGLATTTLKLSTAAVGSTERVGHASQTLVLTASAVGSSRERKNITVRASIRPSRFKSSVSSHSKSSSTRRRWSAWLKSP